MELEDLFVDLEPPSGGLQRLRRRLDAEPVEAPRRRRWRISWVTAAAAAAVVVVWLAVAPAILGGPTLMVAAEEALPGLVHLGLADPPSEPVTVPEEERSRVAIERVTTATDAVVYYRVVTLDDEGKE
jgi:hypothetical protein